MTIAAVAQAPDAARRPTDNQLLRALFTLPPPAHALPLAPQDLPPVKTVTGDAEIDAFLWLREVVATGSPVLIQKAMEAEKRIKTPAKALEERNNAIAAMRVGTPHAIPFVHGIGDLKGLAESAIRDADMRNEALKRFGTKDALFEEQPTEAACRQALRDLKAPKDDLANYDEAKADARFASRLDLSPHTLADCLHVRAYWRQLYWLRNKMERYGGDPDRSASEHDWFCLRSLSRLRPRSRAEAEAVLDHIFDDDVNNDDVEPIVRNLVTGGWS